MSRLCRVVSLAIPAALLAMHTHLAAQQAPQVTFRSNADVVAVDVAVHDANKAVNALAIPDFELRDNGVVQTIASVTFGTLPIDVRLLVDLSSSIQRDQLTRHEWKRDRGRKKTRYQPPNAASENQ